MDARAGVTLAEASQVWTRVALLSFGGPAGQIAVMHRIVVEERRWVDEARFLHALSFCTLLPGPEAQQLATYLGWLMHGTAGGLVAGWLFVLPGMLAILALSLIYAAFGQVGLVAGLFLGLKCAVLAIVLQAVMRLGTRALRDRLQQGIAALAFLALFVFALPFPVVVLAAAVIGWLATFAGSPDLAEAGRAHRAAAPVDTAADGRGRSPLAVCAVLLASWLGPVALLVGLRGSGDVFAEIAVFFSKMAVVGFGGAYAVLAYVAQDAVQTFGWLRPGEMLDGLSMAETTPGPLVMVVQFVGFMGAFRNPGGLDPYAAGVLGALLTIWVTFLPCFLWIFAGAPYVETLRGNRALSGALAAINAAIVGVILDLAIWFALHTLFARIDTVRPGFGAKLEIPVFASVQWPALALTAAAMLAVFRFRVGMIPTLLATGIAGIALHLAGVAKGP